MWLPVRGCGDARRSVLTGDGREEDGQNGEEDVGAAHSVGRLRDCVCCVILLAVLQKVPCRWRDVWGWSADDERNDAAVAVQGTRIIPSASTTQMPRRALQRQLSVRVLY